jgi:hypothetical protein
MRAFRLMAAVIEDDAPGLAYLLTKIGAGGIARLGSEPIMPISRHAVGCIASDGGNWTSVPQTSF